MVAQKRNKKGNIKLYFQPTSYSTLCYSNPNLMTTLLLEAVQLIYYAE